MQIKSERSPAERVETHCSDLCKTSLLLASLSSTDDDKNDQVQKKLPKTKLGVVPGITKKSYRVTPALLNVRMGCFFIYFIFSVGNTFKSI